MLWMILKPLIPLPPLIHSPIFSTLFFVPRGKIYMDYINRTPCLMILTDSVNNKHQLKWDQGIYSLLRLTVSLKQQSLLLSRQLITKYSFLLSSGIYSLPFMSSCLGCINLLTISQGYSNNPICFIYTLTFM